MNIVSTFIGKSVFRVLRMAGRTGSALPGLVVEKTDKRFLASMLAQLPGGVIIVSGTNGKTTTTKLIVRLLESQGMRVLTNPTGSNFVRGTISAVVDGASWRGELPYDIAVFEQDEAHAVHFARQVKLRGLLVLNIMRDQMDRFGEIDTTRKLLQSVADATTDFVVLNANDERVSTIVPPEHTRTIWFGHSAELQPEFLTDDELYHAESASYTRAGEPSVELLGYDEEAISLTVGGTPHRYQYQLMGGHNALNLAAALALTLQIVPESDNTELAKAILTVEPAFGRGETIPLPGGGNLTLQLVKNPGGFTQALRMLALKDYDTIGIAINDDYPDGRDVSWLWDVSFESVDVPVMCGGSRASDMANRLKYDGVEVASYTPDIDEFIDAINGAVAAEGILFCTYTAMLKIRSKYLGAHSGLDDA